MVSMTEIFGHLSHESKDFFAEKSDDDAPHLGAPFVRSKAAHKRTCFDICTVFPARQRPEKVPHLFI